MVAEAAAAARSMGRRGREGEWGRQVRASAVRDEEEIKVEAAKRRPT